MVVELIGMPGVGKTTLTNLLLKNTDSRFCFHTMIEFRKELKSFNRFFLLYGLFYFLVKYSRVFFYGFLAALRCYTRFPVVFVDLLKLWLIYGVWNLKFKDKSEVLLVDGGLFQYAVTLFTTNNKSYKGWLYKKYIDSLSMQASRYIHLSVDSEIAYKRIFARTSGETARMIRLNVELKKKLIFNQKELLENSIQLLIEKDKNQVFNLNTSLPKTQSMRIIQNYLDSVL